MAFFGSDDLIAAPPLSVAMGGRNGSVHHAAGIGVALTSVTGTLIHVGRGIAEAARKKGPGSAALPFLDLRRTLVGGSTAGASAAARSGRGALAGASAASLLPDVVVVVAWSRSRSNPCGPRA